MTLGTRLFNAGGFSTCPRFCFPGLGTVALRTRMRRANRTPDPLWVSPLRAAAMFRVTVMSEEIGQNDQNERGNNNYVHKNTNKKAKYKK
ncbi:hypothetical protein [Ruegeria arenilitoris]|uniref:hypothetical protein n=1 Tax=Ruegeria arenilitoris TaxID=1173585 RepID=UPI00147B9103|nr:hypothetical protein [Ruegeria arenilitoris]